MGNIVPIRKSVEFQEKFNRAKSVEDLRKLEEEIENYLMLNNNDLDSFKVLLLTKTSLGKNEEVIELIEKKFNIIPFDFLVIYIDALLKTGKPYRALELVEEYIKRYQGERERKVLIAKAIIATANLGMYEDTKALFEEIVGINLKEMSYVDVLNSFKELEKTYSLDMDTYLSIFKFLKDSEKAMEVIEEYPYLKRIYTELRRNEQFQKVIPVLKEEDYLSKLEFLLIPTKELSTKEAVELRNKLVKKYFPEEIWENPKVDLVSFSLL
ncbi:MAG: hypothetical protein DSY42_04440 [Aquifex sp.]|nr:MAG: hypothetical protein DSY42_04440 [Aquifex sp.]